MIGFLVVSMRFSLLSSLERLRLDEEDQSANSGGWRKGIFAGGRI
jgi:hypothetical protein